MSDSTNSTLDPRDINKKTEYQEMLDLIENEFLYSTQNLANAVSVDKKTIIAWKQTPPAIKAYKAAVKKVLKLRRRGQLNTVKVLRELKIQEPEDDPQKHEVKIVVTGLETI